MLRAKIEKADWTDWDDTEDIDFNAKAYQIQLITELNSIVEEYEFEEFTFQRAFDGATEKMALSACAIALSYLLMW